MFFSVNITKRDRKRKLRSGKVVIQTRYVLNYADPQTGKRRQEFFDRQKAAQARRNELLAQVKTNTYCDERKAPTVAEAIDHWLNDREGKVKASTLASYKVVVEHIRGPFLAGTPQQRAKYTRTGVKPAGTRLIPMLGDWKVSNLTTAEIRVWHQTLNREVGAYTTNRAIAHLKAIVALAEEDFGVRAPSMPNNLGRTRYRLKKAILNPEQVGVLLREAHQDREKGIYYAFPFLTGTRPSEQLGLLWQDVDFEANIVRIRRVQERDGSLTEMTKTEAGLRDIPLCPMLREMLLEWRLSCPRRCGKLYRVFPGPGRLQAWPLPRAGGGGALLYQNFRKRMWAPVFKRLGLPYVTPHSARHSFISIMQAQGIEVGLVAKLAGHANAVVTLGHYTQAVRGGADAVRALEQAYAAG